MMDDHNAPWLGYLWRLLAVTAGAITSLSFRTWQAMSGKELTMAVFVSFAFGLFFTPVYLDFIQKHYEISSGVAGGIYYATSMGSAALIPRVIKWLGVKTPEEPDKPA